MKQRYYLLGWCVLAVGMFLIGRWVFVYGDFRDDLAQAGVNATQWESKKWVSRNEMTQILAAGNCKDCIHPGPELVSAYTAERLDTFTKEPANNFVDLSLSGAYYYCVAYAGDKWWVNGYPKSTSPFCPWRYCGANTVTQAELIQALFNMIAPSIYAKYSANRQEVNAWKDTLSFDLDIASASTLQKAVDACSNKESCAIWSLEEFSMYLRYCTYNTTACGMRTFPNLEDANPLAQLNVLIKEWVVRSSEFGGKSPFDPVDGDELLRYVERVRAINGCTFEDDYDHDGIINKDDTCALWYNPNQRDQDGDGIGDVCDPDIDNDTVLNPIGIIDDEGTVVARLLSWVKDNCLFVPNTSQDNNDKDRLWDSCDQGADAQAYLAIRAQPVVGTAPLSSAFVAVTSWPVQEVNREFWDGYFGQGKNIVHVFQSPGKYTVIAQVTSKQGVVLVAKQPITVMAVSSQLSWSKALALAKTISLDARPLSTVTGSPFTFVVAPTGIVPQDIRQIQRSFGDKSELLVSSNFQAGLTQLHTYLRPGSYRVQAVVSTVQNEVFVAEVTVYVSGEDVCLWGTKLRCDMDRDGIPDLCDEDVDGDGISQFLGIIAFERVDCRIEGNNTVVQRWQEYKEFLQAWWSGDNCPRDKNPLQEDDNQNFTWNVCEPWGAAAQTGAAQPADQDHDGIPDEDDACPAIPENKNGIQDKDGCPELIAPSGGGNAWAGAGAGSATAGGNPAGGTPAGDSPSWSPTGADGSDGTTAWSDGATNGQTDWGDGDVTDDDSHIDAGPCNSCPCQEANFWSSLWKGDRIRAVLYDEWKSILYRYSPPKIIEVRIPDVMLGK